MRSTNFTDFLAVLAIAAILSGLAPHGNCCAEVVNTNAVSLQKQNYTGLFNDLSEPDIPPGVTISESANSTNVDEEGLIQDNYSIVLDYPPYDYVIVTASYDEQICLETNSAYLGYAVSRQTKTGRSVELIFTPEDWYIPQVVTVTAVDDAVAEGTGVSAIAHSAYSSDQAYNGIGIDNLTVSVLDNDYAVVMISESGRSTDVEETGPTSDSYDVVLTSEPIADVVVTITGDDQVDPGAGPGQPISLTFTPINWSYPQTVTVTAVDDAVVEGPHGSIITHTADSTDQMYNGIVIADVEVNIADDDQAGIEVIEPGNSTDVSEDGPTFDTLMIVLNSKPTADVIITIDPDNQTILGTGPGAAIEMVFTPSNWDTLKMIFVTPVVDNIPEESPHYSTITYNVVSNDKNYHQIALADTTVTISDYTVDSPPDNDSSFRLVKVFQIALASQDTGTDNDSPDREPAGITMPCSLPAVFVLLGFGTFCLLLTGRD